MTPNLHKQVWDLGYTTRVVPVAPPGAKVNPRSTMADRQDELGKIPGRLNFSTGEWSSYDWLHGPDAEESDMARFHRMGAGVGIKTGAGLHLIDADAPVLEQAVLIREHIEKRFGNAMPVRIGKNPKAGYLIRLSDDYPYKRIQFGPEGKDKKPMHRVEILGAGRFFVAYGTHPGTLKPYTWPRELVPFDQLPIFTGAEIEALLNELRPLLPGASEIIREGATTNISQASLRGDIEEVRRAIKAIPNSHNSHPAREDYRDVLYALRASLPDSQEEAFELALEWCEPYVGPGGETNDPDKVKADWDRMPGPYRRGAGWLYEQAAKFTPGYVPHLYPVTPESLKADEERAAAAALEPRTENIFDIAARLAREKAESATQADTFPLLTLDEIMRRPPPVFLIGRHIPEVSVGFLYSRPGAGKSFLALDVSLHIAAGLQEWHGDPIKADPQAVVLYIAAEGSYGFRNRAKAWAKAHGLEHMPARFLMIEQTINFMDAGDIDKLLRTVRGAAGLRPCLIVVDTVSRAMPGADENLQKEMTLFVRACDRLRDAFRCAVLGVHHAGKNGDMRGSTVLLGAGDFVFKLERQEGKTIGRLHCEKQKDAPDGWDEPYSFDSVALDDGESSLVVTRAELSVGPATALTPSIGAAVLGAMQEAWDSGEPWSKAAQAGERRAIRRMVVDFGFTASEAETHLQSWEGLGAITTAERDAKRRRSGFKVLFVPGHDVSETSVFN